LSFSLAGGLGTQDRLLFRRSCDLDYGFCEE
jgi:hypothetical protein